MALINCKECNKEISENAKTCPHCGNPNTIWQANADIKQNVSTADIKRILLIVFGCIFLFVGLFLMFDGMSTKTRNQSKTMYDKETDTYIVQLYP